MIAKNGLDKSITSCMSYQKEMSQSSQSRGENKLKEKVLKFNKEVTSCKNFYLKEGELKTKIFWCKKTDKSCNYFHCPNN